MSVYWQRTRNGSEAIEPADLPTLLAHTGKGGGGQDQFIHAAEERLIPTSYWVEDCENATLKANGATGPLRTDRHPLILPAAGVRRLTPVECERLQSLPDGWTAPPGLHAPDGRRYAAVGDAVTANVAQFIGERLLRYG